MTLPYLDVQRMVCAPVCPVRAMPRGNTHRLLTMSLFQSMDRAVITWPLAPWNTSRVQAQTLEAAATPARPSNMAAKEGRMRGMCMDASLSG